MAITILEAAKQVENDPLKAGIIEQIGMSNDLMQVMPIETIVGSAIEYTRENTLPSVAFRNVNAGYTANEGEIERLKAGLKIAGGDLDVDKFIVDTMGTQIIPERTAMKAKALGLLATKKFIKGDETASPNEFDGLQNLITESTQIIDEGAGALSLANLDKLIDAVDSPTHLIMNKALRRRLIQASRSTSVGGTVNFELNSFGAQIATYAGIPILVIDKDEAGNDILPFSEDSGSNSSIYCVSFGSGAYTGIQNGTINTRFIGELEDKPVYRTRVEWYLNHVLWSKYAAARLKRITDAAVTV